MDFYRLQEHEHRISHVPTTHTHLPQTLPLHMQASKQQGRSQTKRRSVVGQRNFETWALLRLIADGRSHVILMQHASLITEFRAKSHSLQINER